MHKKGRDQRSKKVFFINGLAGLRTCGAGLGNMTETENGLLALKFNEC